MDKAIQIGEALGVIRKQSSCDYSYLIRVRSALNDNAGRFKDLAYIQKLIDILEAK
jgi:DNA-binding MltR family transcriptional regulator